MDLRGVSAAIGGLTRRTAFRRAFFWSAALVFAVFGAVAWAQANRSRQIVRKNHGNAGEWEGAGPVEGILYECGRLTHHISMPAANVTSSGGRVPALEVQIPYSRWGYVLNITTRKVEGAELPLLEFLVNGAPIGQFQVRKHYPKIKKTRDCHEVMIPGRALSAARRNCLVIRNAAGNGWQGRMLLIKYGFWRPILNLLLPLSACWVLAGSLLMKDRRWVGVRPFLVLGVFFVTYYYTGMSKKMAPAGGFFLDDSASFVRHIMANAMAQDMKKHMLFLPVMYGMWRVMMVVFRGVELYAMAAAFALVSAGNAATAYLWFRRRLGSDRGGMLLVILYGFSFAVWVHSSIIESYALSSLLLNTFMLALVLEATGTKGVWIWGLRVVLVVVAGLAHPPLLILVLLLAGRVVFSEQRPAAKFALPVVFVVLVFTGFLLGQGLIRNSYRVTKSPSVRREADFAEAIVRKYGTTEHLTVGHAGNVLLGQFAYAVGGLPYGHRWYKGWSGCLDYLRTVPGFLFVSACLLLWLAALGGVAGSGARLKRAAFLLGFVVVPYLCFFWYFNPAEMFLYSAPLVSPVLCGLAEYGGAALDGRRDYLLGAAALFTLLLNTTVMTTYC